MKTKTAAKKTMDYLKNKNPTFEETIDAIKEQNRQSRISERVMNQSLEIDKVSYKRKDGVMEISYKILSENSDSIDVKLKSNDEPLPELVETLNSLHSFVDDICNFEKGYCDMAEIRGVSFSHSSGIMGAVITALVPVATAYSPVCINTPHLPSGQYNEGGEAPTLPRKCIDVLNELMILAENYVNGERKPDNQTKLELE